jgi:pimeloyl-ACP methyl ester carboxylesterase
MTSYGTVNVDGVGIFYREAGSPEAPTVVLLHGFPSSSHMYRELIPALADQFHLVAPDYPGFGNSDSPAVDQFRYSFDHLSEVMEQFLQALGLSRFSLYVQDYGSPVGFRIAARHPDWIQALIIQNANAYLEGISPALASLQSYWQNRNEETQAIAASLLTPESVKSFYTQGAGHPERLSPDAWSLDQFFLNRPGSGAIQLELLYDYRTNPERYPEWHDYFRRHQPPTLVVWGKNDPFFTVPGALAYQRDLRNIEVHLLDTGHFALEDEGDAIAAHIRRFLPAHLHEMGVR